MVYNPHMLHEGWHSHVSMLQPTCVTSSICVSCSVASTLLALLSQKCTSPCPPAAAMLPMMEQHSSSWSGVDGLNLRIIGSQVDAAFQHALNHISEPTESYNCDIVSCLWCGGMSLCCCPCQKAADAWSRITMLYCSIDYLLCYTTLY